MRRWSVGALLVGALALVAVALIRRPQAERAWADDFARISTATPNPDGAITLHNVRDWTYSDTAILSKDWRDETVNPETIVGASFLIEPFSAWKAIGHTFLSFQFRDGAVLSFSVEARRKAGQPYSPLQGALQAYELAYQWGTERDFVTRRMLYLHHPLRLYPLNIEAKTAQALFMDLIGETNALARRPRFYNTVTDNCTNTLAYVVNRHAPRTLPWSWSWYFSGYADEYLMKHGFILVDGGSIERTKAMHDLTPHQAAIRAIATKPPSLFSADLRALELHPRPAG